VDAAADWKDRSPMVERIVVVVMMMMMCMRPCHDNLDITKEKET